jgi:hypothetical protein
VGILDRLAVLRAPKCISTDLRGEACAKRAALAADVCSAYLTANLWKCRRHSICSLVGRLTGEAFTLSLLVKYAERNRGDAGNEEFRAAR